MTAAMRATRRPYSTAVAPRSDRSCLARKFCAETKGLSMGPLLVRWGPCVQLVRVGPGHGSVARRPARQRAADPGFSRPAWVSAGSAGVSSDRPTRGEPACGNPFVLRRVSPLFEQKERRTLNAGWAIAGAFAG